MLTLQCASPKLATTVDDHDVRGRYASQADWALAYLQDRVRGAGQIPRLAELIRRKAEETPARKAVAAPLA